MSSLFNHIMFDIEDMCTLTQLPCGLIVPITPTLASYILGIYLGRLIIFVYGMVWVQFGHLRVSFVYIYSYCKWLSVLVQSFA